MRARLRLGRHTLPAMLVAVLLAAPQAIAAPAITSCAAPTEITRLHGGLARTATRLARHDPLTIVALGSSSTAGTGASTPARNYPNQLAEAMRRLLPGQPITILNKGIGGEITSDMTARLDRDVLAFDPDLVIWQVGTNTVLRDGDVSRNREVLGDGIGRLKAAGIDVVIMDVQYAPMVLAHPRYRDMERMLAAVSKEQGVALFRRFDLMQRWQESGQLDFATMLAPDGLHLNDLSYGCIGRLLANAIVERAVPGMVTARR